MNPTFALMTWNIGYFDYESDSRAQNKDLEAIAAVISETGAQVDCTPGNRAT